MFSEVAPNWRPFTRPVNGLCRMWRKWFRRIVGYTEVIAKRASWVADYPQPGSSAIHKPASQRRASHFKPKHLKLALMGWGSGSCGGAQRRRYFPRYFSGS